MPRARHNGSHAARVSKDGGGPWFETHAPQPSVRRLSLLWRAPHHEADWGLTITQ